MAKIVKRLACLLFVVVLGFAPGLTFATDEEGVESSFKAFQEVWLKKLAQHGSYGPQHVKVEKIESDNETSYVAKYRELGEPLSSRIKKTEKKGSPYVGVFSYEEVVYSNKGNSEEEAAKGPFKCEKTVVITEIFPYLNGKWVY